MKHSEQVISKKLSIQDWQVEQVLKLISGGATIPFIARYRKEMTGSLTDEVLYEIQQLHKQIQSLNERRQAILKSLEEQQITDAELLVKIHKATSMSGLEDLYLPYKPKRKTKATIARAKGLEPLARMIMSEKVDKLNAVSSRFINPSKGVGSEEEALEGARHIIAEWISEKDWVRSLLRNIFEREARIYCKPVKNIPGDDSKYKSFYAKDEILIRMPSHRYLAVLRGEAEGFLQLKVFPDKERTFEVFRRRLIKANNEAARHKHIALEDSLKRLLFPAMETELKSMAKEKADVAAIKVFAENLKQLLLAPPMGGKNTMAIDPGFRTGCKLVCLDSNGNLKHNETIFPHPPQRETALAVKKIKSLLSAYKIEAVAIGNGTAGRETQDMIKRAKLDFGIKCVMVNENGASVYSASALAREEFPDYDVTVRGAVSIGRRLMDPLAELVKIDPKSIGVGQYQHDVNQKALQERLKTEVESCVNSVGVALNTASKELLSHVSGIGPKLASQIIDHRSNNGPFKSKESLKKVKGLGAKAFEQCAGFLRIRKGDNPLDASAVHPENYGLVKKMAADIGIPLHDMIANKELRKRLELEAYITNDIGLPTLNDILDELEKPGRDPRDNYTSFEFDKNIKHIDDLKPGMILPALVNNITDFGAFVDLGIHESGLIHKSQIADAYVHNPSDYLVLNQQLMVKVLDVDVERKRISLSLRGV